MIISHKHKFVFFRVRKTASTSIQLFLAKQCGPDDIISKIFNFDPKRDKDNYKTLPGQNIKFIKDGKAIHVDIFKLLQKNPKLKVFIEKYKKIISVRNPWDAKISQFWHRIYLDNQKISNNEIKQSFKSFVKNNESMKNYKYYFDSLGGKTFDFIIRYENIENDLKKLCKQLNIKYEPLLSTKSLLRPNIPYQKYYDEELIEIIRTRNKKIIDYFGYTF